MRFQDGETDHIQRKEKKPREGKKTLAQRVQELEQRVAYLEKRDAARGLSGMVIGARV